MGRIRSKDIKLLAFQLLATNKFTDNFEKNKILVEEMKLPLTKRMKNKVAGYVTRLVKNTQKVKDNISEDNFN
ncbi:MAG: 30S ribosomal protein S17e [Candidatus Aenigmatarchaeota archaeon]|nr:30S ribosomal protein S17e [Candidatus Aenigmarchaeota archaeon]